MQWRYINSVRQFVKQPEFKQMIVAATLCVSLIGCSGPSVRPGADGPPIGGPAALDKTPDAIPRAEPLSKYGNPVSYEVFGEKYFVLPDSRGYKQRGRASWYGRKFHGKRTSSGEPYDMYGMTAAHRTLPLPTYVRVTNLDNGRQVVVRVNDRGPFHSNRIIDLSYTAAVKLDIIRHGTGRVEVEALDPATPPGTTAKKPAEHMPVALESRPIVSAQPPAPAEPEKAVIKEAPRTEYYLQAGAFSNKTNALKLIDRLKQAGLQSVELFETGLDRLFRVRVGPYADNDLLHDDRKRLLELGINSQINSY